MLRGESDFQFSKNVICSKWFGNKPVLLLATNIEGMDGTSNVMRRTKRSARKISVSCSNIIKLYNASMGDVAVIDQKTSAYRLDCKRKFRFQLRMFFDLIDIAIVNNHIVYTKFGNSIYLLDFKTVVAKSLIGRYSNQELSFLLSRTSKQKALESSLPKDVPTNMPEFNEKRMRCILHKKCCLTCGLYFCCTKERNCFLKYHIQILYNTNIVVL